MVKKVVKRKANQGIELPLDPIKIKDLKREEKEENEGDETMQDDFMPLDLPSPPISPSTKKKLNDIETKDKKLNKVKKEEKEDKEEKDKESSVIYIGRIPHGFYEDQMKGFFSQFGTVNKIRLSRNKKTGNSKGYAFVEFEFSEVAKIVAECMDKFLLFGKILQVHVVPTEKIHPKLFVGANHKFYVVDRRKIEIERRRQPKTLEEQQKCISTIIKSESKRRKKIAASGIDYEFEAIESLVPAKPKHVKF